jgi:hypothetical protein
MSCTYETAVADLQIRVTVNADWSGLARIGIDRYDENGKATGHAQAVCSASRLLVGIVDEVGPEAGQIRWREWPMVVALAVREHFRARAIAHIEGIPS